MLPPTDRGGPNCTCHECQHIHCMLPHFGHSHRDHQRQTTWESLLADMRPCETCGGLTMIRDGAGWSCQDPDCNAHLYVKQINDTLYLPGIFHDRHQKG